MTDVHFGYAELYGLGQQIVDAAVEAVQRYYMIGFGTGIPQLPGSQPVSVKDSTGPKPDLDYARNLLAAVPELFASFAGPDPASCGTVAGQVNAIRQALGDTLSAQDEDQAPAGSWRPSPAIAPTLNAVYNQARTWQGSGAIAFEDYIDNLRQPNCVVEHQGEVATVLTVGIRAHQRILTWAYQDIWSIGQETIKVLEAGGTGGGCDAPGGNIFMQILSGIAWVAAATVTDGTAAILLTGLAAATGSGGGFLPQQKYTTVHGTTMLSVISSMTDAVGKLLDYIGKQQSFVAGRLAKATEIAEGWYAGTGPNSAGLYAPPPDLFANAGDWTPA